ncbi:zf-CCHC domain-containing protein, partial [Tanacetum coccineum]
VKEVDLRFVIEEGEFNGTVMFVSNRDYGVTGDDYEGPPVFDDDQYEKEIVSGDVGNEFVDNYPNFQEDGNNFSFSSVVLRVEEESMPVYDTDIEEVFVGKGGFGGEKDNIEDIVVVANDLCSSIIQTTLNVDFEEDINTKSHELMSFGKNEENDFQTKEEVEPSIHKRKRQEEAGATIEAEVVTEPISFIVLTATKPRLACAYMSSSKMFPVEFHMHAHAVLVCEEIGEINMIIKSDDDKEKLALFISDQKESSDKKCSTSRSEDEEYAMTVRDFKKFFKRRGRFVRQPQNDKKTFQRSRDDKNGKSEKKCFRCEDPDHLIGECPIPPRDKNQKAFIGGSWSNSGEEDDEKIKDETYLVAQTSNEVCSDSSYFSNENSSIDDLALDNEYDKICKMSLKIITKNKRLKAVRNSLENELSELKEKFHIREKRGS